jgi:hypothetical protein
MIFIFNVSSGLNRYLLGRYPQNENVNTLNKVESENKNVNTLNKVENENSIFNTIGPIVYYADYDTVRLIETEEYSAIEVQKLPESLVISSGYYQYMCCLSAKWKNGIHVIVHKRSQNHEKKAQALQSGRKSSFTKRTPGKWHSRVADLRRKQVAAHRLLSLAAPVL